VGALQVFHPVRDDRPEADVAKFTTAEELAAEGYPIGGSTIRSDSTVLVYALPAHLRRLP
jgi:hypothetical protein